MLYLGLATTALLVLGPTTGDSTAPLSDVLAIGIGGQVRLVTALVAVLLTIGAMNAYFAGGSKLGAALGRDGGLPAWISHGSAVGQVPRRSLLITGVLATIAQLAAAIFRLDVTDLVLLTTGGFTLVYIFGTAAAVRLLPRRTVGWWTAVIALGSVLVLAGLTGLHLVWALAVALGGYLYSRLPRRS